jgi:hypothetical protein
MKHALLVASLLLATSQPRAKSQELALHLVRLDLPGPPAAVVATDLDADGRHDLLVVVAYTEIEEIGFDRIEGMVQIATVIPAVFDRREARAYLQREDGTYLQAGEPLPLPPSVISIDSGPTGLPAIALTDDGVSEVRYVALPAPHLELAPLIADRPVLAGSAMFLPDLELVRDIDGDGTLDLLLPALDGPAVYLGTGKGLNPAPAARLRMPGDRRSTDVKLWRTYPMPRVQDLDGDRIPDLVIRPSQGGGSRHLMRGTGGGRFAPLRTTPLDLCDTGTELRVADAPADADPGLEDLEYVGDIDGDGRAEVVAITERDLGEDAGMRQELKAAKNPQQTVRLHHLRDDMQIEGAAFAEFEAMGHPLDVELPNLTLQPFQDLDGDGRKELITFSMDFSLLQVVRVLTTKKVSIGLEFHIWHQTPDGKFREVQGLDLTETLKLDLDDLKIGRFAEFAGDFDGDGRQEFIHLGRGKTVTLHRGQLGCTYAKKPDLTIELDEPIEDLALVRVRDLDGDGRSDLMITRAQPAGGPGDASPVRLDLYLTRGPR